MNRPEQLSLDMTSRESWSIKLRVNGVERTVQCDPATRFSDVLRDQLGLTGTKIGCSAGDCGACTVLVNRRQVCACLVAAAQVEGCDVTTVEGLARGDSLNHLQRAFLAHGATQCGICTPGMLMAAMDLLARKPHPTEQEVQDGLGGVLCRCTGYRKIVEAVLAASRHEVVLVEPTAGKAVGSRVAKLDGVERLTGLAKFGADLAPAGALWLRAIRSPHARAAFVIGDYSALRTKYAGLVDVITAADVPENCFSIFSDVKDQPVFAATEARFCGEAVAALVGDLETVMAIADGDLPIEWKPLFAMAELQAAIQATDAVHASRPDNVLCRGRVIKGDVEAALKRDAIPVEGEFETSYIEHAYIEPEAGYAEYFTENGVERIRVFSCTQTPYMDRDEIARILRIAPTQVHIVPSAIGGGFGGKLDIAVQPLLAVAAWKLKRPVRAVYTRPESMTSTTKRHPSHMRAQIACDGDGNLVAVDFHGDFNTGAYASWGNTVATRVPIHASGPYFVPNVRALTRAVYTNGPIAGAFRGFGVPQSTFATETLMDELAAKIGMDPLEFRHRNAIRAGQATATGQILTASCGLVRCLETLRPVWQESLRKVEEFNRLVSQQQVQGKRRGVGIACMWYGIGNTVIANPSTMRVALRSNGRLMLYNGAVDIGQGSTTILAQVCADAVGLPVSLIDQIDGDTDLTPDAGKTSASRQAFVSGNAAKRAGEDLRRKLLALVGAQESAQLRIEQDVLIACDVVGEHRIDLQGLAPDGSADIAVGEGYFNPPTVPLDEEGQGIPYATYAFAAQMAEVEVDLALGTVEVRHMHAAHDVGRALNPTQVEGQIHGGIAQGLGMALMEEYVPGHTDNLHDYLIPTVGDMPTISTYLIEEPEPLGPYGAKGVGEPALIATAPAITNAIRHATGVRVISLPVTPDRLLALLRAAQKETNP